MKIKDFLILFGIIGIISIAVSLAVNELASQYDQNIDVSDLQDFNSVNELQNKTESMHEAVTSGGFSFTSLGGILVNGIGVFFSLVLGMVVTPIKWLNKIAEVFEIPSVFVYAIASLVIIVVIVAIIAVILKREP